MKERTIFDELTDNYKKKLADAEKRIQLAEKQVQIDKSAIAHCYASNELPELEQDLRESQQALSEAINQRQAILADLKDLEK